MKKLYLFSFSLLSSISLLKAQSSLLVTNFSDGQSVVANNAIIYEGLTANANGQTDFNIKNTSSVNKTYKLRRFDDVLNSGSVAFFCFDGTCYGAPTYTSPTTLTLTPNQDVYSLGKIINIHLDESATVGQSDIRYQIYDPNNPSDVFTFTMKYNNPLSLNHSAALFSNVSAVYPNPCSDKAQITVMSGLEINNVALTLINSLGSIVYSKNIELTLGKNTIGIETATLSSGIYFLSIASGNTKTVKKFTVNK